MTGSRSSSSARRSRSSAAGPGFIVVTVLSLWSQVRGAVQPGSDWSRAASLTHLAYAHAQAGDVDESCGTAVKATTLARRSGSVRLARRLSEVHASLATRYPGDPRVAELAEALR